MIGTVHDGRYRILAKLGAGGMGEVYLVEHLNLGRKEAFKVLHPELAAMPKFVSRFRREARATNRLQHANIVGVYDFGQLSDGRFFLTMEHAEGERLDRVLRNVGPLPVPRALHILVQLADAVDHAHQQGVVHRDLKPENLVLIEHRGHADVLKVLDFGLAKIIAPEYRESIGLTRKGEVFGTPAYMAPEQLTDDNVEPRSDIYAIGCIAFELLTGEPPFLGRTVELAHAHMTRAPDAPGKRRPHARIPAELDALVLRCLAKKPDLRYQTGAELKHALEQISGFRSGRTPSGPRSRPRLQPLRDEGGVPTTHRDMPALLDEETGRHDITALDDANLTQELSAEQAVVLRDVALRKLAEALLDLGQRDFQLLVGVSKLSELENQITAKQAELASLEQRAEDLEQSAREHEGSLRFALGELRFERAKALERGEVVSRDLDFQITSLAKRLEEIAAETTTALAEVTDRAIDLTAKVDRRRDELTAMCASLESLVDDIAPRHLSDRHVAALYGRLNDAREMMRQAR